MSNYEYIIASLPFLTTDYKYADGTGFDAVLEEIRRDLSAKDNALVDFLLQGFDGAELTPDFYAEALRHKCRFLREYFRFDLNLRNAKVRYLNRQLGRADDTDVMTGMGTADDTDLDIDLRRFSGGEFDEKPKVEFVLVQEDLLTRERGLDDILWTKIDSLTTFHYFDITAVLGYIARLHIVDRWLSLDEEAGRELFHKLVKQVKGTYKGVQFEDK